MTGPRRDDHLRRLAAARSRAVREGVTAESVSTDEARHLGNGFRPLMVFDKNCHVSMAGAKPTCADETEVVTCYHHDVGSLEDMCKQHERVCYVVDGSGSLGGYAPVRELAELQEKYGLLVFYDDSHSISAYGGRGIDYIRSHCPVLDERTITVATLNKAFGTSGAAIMLDGYPKTTLRVIERLAGALSYSQPLNTARGLGLPGVGGDPPHRGADHAPAAAAGQHRAVRHAHQD